MVRHIDIPALAARRKLVAGAPARVDGNHNALAAKARCRFTNDGGVVHGGAVNAHLVGPGNQDVTHVLHSANAAAHSERDKDRVGHTAHHVTDNRARFVRCRNVEKDQLIGPLTVVDLRLRNRIACVYEVHKVDTLDDTTVFDIQAGNDAPCQHGMPLRYVRA